MSERYKLGLVFCECKRLDGTDITIRLEHITTYASCAEGTAVYLVNGDAVVVAMSYNNFQANIRQAIENA